MRASRAAGYRSSHNYCPSVLCSSLPCFWFFSSSPSQALVSGCHTFLSLPRIPFHVRLICTFSRSGLLSPPLTHTPLPATSAPSLAFCRCGHDAGPTAPEEPRCYIACMSGGSGPTSPPPSPFTEAEGRGPSNQRLNAPGGPMMQP